LAGGCEAEALQAKADEGRGPPLNNLLPLLSGN
jgi:hypothetical protein